MIYQFLFEHTGGLTPPAPVEVGPTSPCYHGPTERAGTSSVTSDLLSPPPLNILRKMEGQ